MWQHNYHKTHHTTFTLPITNYSAPLMAVWSNCIASDCNLTSNNSWQLKTALQHVTRQPVKLSTELRMFKRF
jgi:hypothetical protein